MFKLVAAGFKIFNFSDTWRRTATTSLDQHVILFEFSLPST